MSIFGYTGAFFKHIPYSFCSREAQLKIQDRRLKSLLKYAKENSEYYNSLIDEDLNIANVKPTNKIELLKHFDEIVTDKRLKLEDIKNEIFTNPDGGSLLDGLYSATMTSGSTGNPTIIVQDKKFQNSVSVVSFIRQLGGKLPIVMLGGNDGYGVGGELIKNNKAKSAFIKKIVHIVDVTAPLDEIKKELLRIGPSVLIAYTSTLTILASKLIDEDIRIKEKIIYISGEFCSESDKNIIRKAFYGTEVREIYGCTEGGSMACECKYGHLHIAQDLVKLEPVDENNNVLPYEVMSEKALLTNLNNYVQPIIRYEISDRIALHKGCPCGCKDDWIEIEERTNDKLIFEENGNEIVIPSVSTLVVMAEVNMNGLTKFKNYQMAVSKNKHILLTLDYYKDVNKEAINKEIVDKLNEFFISYGVNGVSYEFVEGIPNTTTKTGKRKRIYMVA